MSLGADGEVTFDDSERSNAGVGVACDAAMDLVREAAAMGAEEDAAVTTTLTADADDDGGGGGAAAAAAPVADVEIGVAMAGAAAAAAAALSRALLGTTCELNAELMPTKMCSRV